MEIERGDTARPAATKNELPQENAKIAKKNSISSYLCALCAPSRQKSCWNCVIFSYSGTDWVFSASGSGSQTQPDYRRFAEEAAGLDTMKWPRKSAKYT
jgi:hypothetical protein